MPTLWPAPVATEPVQASVQVPGSKSQTARELVLSAVATEPTTLVGPLAARDTLLMAAALQALGASITDAHGAPPGTTPTDREQPVSEQPVTWLIHPGPLRGDIDVQCGLAGTVMRFLPPVAALAPGLVRFSGDMQAAGRPMQGLLDALRGLGTRVDQPNGANLPFTVHGQGRVPGGTITVAAAESSQFVSGLLLAGCRYEAGLEVRATGPVPSRPHVSMTVGALRGRGLSVQESEPATWQVSPGEPRGGVLRIEPDLSNAAPFLAAAAVTGGRVSVLAWPSESQQPGHDLPRLLQQMGATVHHRDRTLEVAGPDRLGGLGEVDLSHAGELTPTVAALAALADSPTRIRGVAHLRGHETDRLAALTNEINALGGDARQVEDGLDIYPRPLRGGVVGTYQDHRMATTAAILGLCVPGVLVEDIGTTAKTLPDFPRMWQDMLA